MHIDILTLFPDMFQGVTSSSITGRAVAGGVVKLDVHNIRDFTHDRHHVVDDYTYGGGPGMVLKPEPVFECLDALVAGSQERPRMLLPSPVGRQFDQELARELSAESHVVVLCGRYEGYDERIVDGWAFEEVSIGDYIVTGGEVPAMVLVDAVTRLLPGVLGHDLSALEDTFEAPLLDHPHYTRPAEYRGMRVPEVLLSGDHARVAEWRREQSLKRTRERRPDLLPDSETEG